MGHHKCVAQSKTFQFSISVHSFGIIAALRLFDDKSKYYYYYYCKHLTCKNVYNNNNSNSNSKIIAVTISCN